MSPYLIFWRTFYLLVNPFRKLYWRIVQPETRGAKCLVLCDGKFLLTRLSYAHKRWTLPGGGVERNESFEEGALRELQEETGISLPAMDFFGEYKSRLHYKHNTVQCFSATVTNPQLVIDPLEITQAGWFSKNQLPSDRQPTVDTIIAMYESKTL